MTTTDYYDIIITDDSHSHNLQNSIYTRLSIMQYALSCHNDYYMVFDSNTLLCHDLQIFDDKSQKPYIDLRSLDDHNVYFDVTSQLLPGFKNPNTGSYNTGHMLIYTGIMKSLISYIENNSKIKGSDYVEKIINCCEVAARAAFSVFELYGTYVSIMYPSSYIPRKWNCFTQGGVFFKKTDITPDDLQWLSKDYNSVTFMDGDEYVQEYSDLFHRHYYREKLTPAQILQAIYADTEADYDVSNNGFYPQDRLKYLSEDTYREYEALGDKLININKDQAYLCYENASFLCNNTVDATRIISKKKSLSDKGGIRTNKIAFIVISFNNLDFTIHCLESIYSNCNPEAYLLMIFDNGSTDGSQEWLSRWGEEHEEALVILNDTNLGFSGGNNACCRYLPEGYDVFYLNNDTRIPPNALFWMRMALYSSDDIGGVGAIQNYSKGDQLDDVYFDLPEQYVEYGAKHNIYEPNPYEEQSKLCGFAMLISREMYDSTGGFDEQFNPGFLEDEDLSLQIRSLGKHLISCQNAFIYHAGSQSFRKRNDINELFKVNRKKIIKKWGFDPTLYAAMSENEYEFTKSLKVMGYNKDSRFTLVHIGCGCGNMLGHIHYLYPNAILIGVEKNDIARKYAISRIPVLPSIDDLPMQLCEYDVIARNLG